MGSLHSLPSVAHWTSVVTFDPGMDTGWAWLTYERLQLRSAGAVDTILSAGASGLFRCGQLDIGGSPPEETVGAQVMVRYVELSTGRAMEKLGMEMGSSEGGDGSPLPLRQVVVCESFQLRQRTMDSSLLSPVRLQSKLEAVLAEHHYQGTYVTQTPNEKSSITDERLQRWGLVAPRHLTCKCHRHSNDALRHLLVWLRKDAKL